METNLSGTYIESIKPNVPNKNEKRAIFGFPQTVGQQIERKFYGEQNDIKNKFDRIKEKCLSQVCSCFIFFMEQCK